jgi:ribosomal-protein-alanine N-acetyltransferase
MLIDVIPMTLHHLDEVHLIESRSFLTPWSKESIQNDLSNPHAFYFAAVLPETGQVIGYAGMWHIVNEGHINNIAVDEPYRRIGAASKLIDRLIHTAYEMEMIGLTLEVRMGNRAAMALYNKYGFKMEGIRKGYYTDTNEDAVIMWKYFNTSLGVFDGT